MIAGLVALFLVSPLHAASTGSGGSLYGRSFDSARVNACVQSLCGPSRENLTMKDALTARRVESVQFQELWAGVGPRIQRALKAEDDVRRLTAIPDLRAGREMAALFIVHSRLSSKLEERAERLLKSHMESDEAEINERSFAEFLKTQPRAAHRALRALLKTYVFQSWQEDARAGVSGENPFDVRLLSRYGDIEPRDALAADAKAAAERIERADAAFGAAFVSEFVSSAGRALLRKVAAGSATAVSEKDLYLETVQIADRFASIMDPAMAPLLRAVPVNMEAEFAKAKALLARIPVPKKGNPEIAAACRTKLNVDLSRNVSGLRLNQAAGMLAEIKSAAKDIVPRLLDPAQAALIAQKIDGVDFVMPGTPQKRLDDFLEALDVRQAELDSALARLASADVDREAGLIVKLIALRPPKNEAPLSRIEELCNSLSSDTASDAAFPALNMIKLSWYSLNYPDVGVGVIAHEMGHIVSRNAIDLDDDKATARYRKSLACVKGRNGFAQDTSEEDWADHFSVAVLKNLAARGSRWAEGARNHACPFMSDAGEEYARNHLAPVPGDEHSAPFVRALLMARDLSDGKLPAACQPFVAAAAAQKRPLKCDASF